MIAQKNIEAFKKTARPENTFLLKQNPQDVTSRVEESLKILKFKPEKKEQCDDIPDETPDQE